ncbi:MAG: aromatic ring-hydroxylating dioxygenase subunit alpha [Nitrospinae bacterium]|nr:aromatic ring-hydroxylating dioxygenase subunit alpha [Nitrospinota bacterium]
MKHDRQMALLDRMVALRKRREDQQIYDTVLRLPLDVYTSQEIFERELDTLFFDSPLLAGHVDSVREPGSYMLSDWTRQPYFVVRGEDGVLRAFLNTCRHRGAPLILRENDEPLRALVCPYHGWIYGLDGALQGIPRSFAFPCIDKRDYGLKECSVAESTGLVWVHPTRHESFDPAQDMGAFAEDIAEFHLERFVTYRKVVTEKKANWKLLIQANLEGYHTAQLHKGTMASNFREGFLSFDAEGPHLRVLAAKTNLLDAENVPEKQRKLLDFVSIFYVLFPNTIVLVRGDNILISRFLPLAPDRTLSSQELLYLPDKYVGESGRKALRNRLLYSEVLLDDEDFMMAERVQANLLNGVNETHMLGLEEGLVMVFQEIVSKRLAARDATTADSP